MKRHITSLHWLVGFGFIPLEPGYKISSEPVQRSRGREPWRVVDKAIEIWSEVALRESGKKPGDFRQILKTLGEPSEVA